MQILTARGGGGTLHGPTRTEDLAKPALFTARECLPRCRATGMKVSRPHRHSRRYSAGVLDRIGGLNGNGGSPGIRQSRPRVPGFSAPGAYSRGVPRHQSARVLGEHLQPSARADTGIADRACTHALATRSGECLQASRAIPGLGDSPRWVALVWALRYRSPQAGTVNIVPIMRCALVAALAVPRFA